MKRLGINTANAVLGIIGAVMTGTMLLWMITDVSVVTYYVSGIAFLVLNIIGLVKQKKHGGKTVGNILGIIASSLHAFSGLLALPACILYIIATVFLFKDKVQE